VIEIVEYIDSLGRSPFEKWRLSLDENTEARISTAILRLSEGNISAVKSVGAGVYELRMHFGPGYRVYFGKEGEKLVILLGGGTKLRQQKDIEVAHRLWSQHKREKGL
jgi:putative addiction module killer protein